MYEQRSTIYVQMAFLTTEEAAFARAISGVAFGNPFLPARIEFEKQALGEDFLATEAVWSFRSDLVHGNPNVIAMAARNEETGAALRERLARGRSRPRAAQLALYEDLIVYLLFSRYQLSLLELIERPELVTPSFYGEFVSDFEHYLRIDGVVLPSGYQPAHLFACFFQIRRAFHHIFENIVGSSMAAARLRAAVWQSIFTHDLRRFQRSLYDKLSDVTTLIIGATGTGKELVARAIGLSRYIPFDERQRRFGAEPAESLVSVNLSALAPTLIESELFGHRKGAFTGALQDRKGWLEVCGPHGAVFLDEIGDLDGSIQVKLLRVLQSRTFQRLGETATRYFHGKIIAATNRDLPREMARGRFREDFFYRLCSDLITTPTLYDQLREDPDELLHLTRFIAERLAGPNESDRLANEAMASIRKSVGDDYRWLGNFRELEQCVRSVMVHGRYQPLARAEPEDVRARITARFLDGAMSGDELLSVYCTMIYARTASYVDAARRLGIDRRTVRARVDHALLEQLRPPP
jgi:DNA-binding NtrC family response regulator